MFKSLVDIDIMHLVCPGQLPDQAVERIEFAIGLLAEKLPVVALKHVPRIGWRWTHDHHLDAPGGKAVEQQLIIGLEPGIRNKFPGVDHIIGTHHQDNQVRAFRQHIPVYALHQVNGIVAGDPFVKDQEIFVAGRK